MAVHSPADINHDMLQERMHFAVPGNTPVSHVRSSTPPQQELLAEINEAGYEIYLSYCVITNAKDNSNLLLQEVYPLANSFVNFVNLCNEYIAAKYSPALDAGTMQIYNLLTTGNWYPGDTVYQISSNILKPPTNNFAEDWEGVLASLYHAQDPNSISVLWNICVAIANWEPAHPPTLSEGFSQPLLADVQTLQTTWGQITTASIDPANSGNILPTLAADLVAVNTDLTNNLNSQGYLTANEQALYDALNAPLEGAFNMSLIGFANDVVSSPTSENLTWFGNFVAGANYYIVSVLEVSLESNPTIYLY
ncbi:MAG: hypothetical protein JSR39_07070 [Verrucomicrobia bacterium]|nr:hypothetical protein [Verrucomicrobiota bacterium]